MIHYVHKIYMGNKISITHKKLIIDTNIIGSALHRLSEAAKKLVDAADFWPNSSSDDRFNPLMCCSKKKKKKIISNKFY
jgi:hypothetical protein